MYLKDKIIKLIESHQEADYYDFKEAWHDNKAEFLHDILSLANNRTVEDGLLIFGVRDKTFEIIGVENDPNRKTQQNIIDFLNTKAFFGGIRPSVELKTINYLKHELDILIVKNTNDTPYYLADKYSDGKYTIRPNYIYTRIKDTNTPIDKSADINQVEYLWKKRFLLTESPIKRIFNELKYPQNWERKNSIKDNIPFYYNIYHPEFTVEILDDDYSDSNNTEFYSYKQINHSTSFGIIAVKYFNTEVYTTQYVCLDGGRYMTITPQWAFPEIEKYKNVDYSYKYFLLIRFHDLRHSCASLLLVKDIKIKAIQEWLGHSCFSTTANLYAHLDSKSKQESAEALVNALKFTDTKKENEESTSSSSQK